jgi:hypothetical protein
MIFFPSEEMSDTWLSADVIWSILRFLPCNDIVYNRQVSCIWRQTIDELTNDDWRNMFGSRVCRVLCVGDHFDWKVAAVNASRALGDTIEASCTWHNVSVRMRAPWKSVHGIDAPLSPGIVRGGDSQNTHIVDYVYDDTFRLRGLGRTCVQQFNDECSNCLNKRQCLFMRYTYYVRPLQDSISTELDECLSRRLCDT